MPLGLLSLLLPNKHSQDLLPCLPLSIPLVSFPHPSSPVSVVLNKLWLIVWSFVFLFRCVLLFLLSYQLFHHSLVSPRFISFWFSHFHMPFPLFCQPRGHSVSLCRKCWSVLSFLCPFYVSHQLGGRQWSGVANVCCRTRGHVQCKSVDDNSAHTKLPLPDCSEM